MSEKRSDFEQEQEELKLSKSGLQDTETEIKQEASLLLFVHGALNAVRSSSTTTMCNPFTFSRQALSCFFVLVRQGAKNVHLFWVVLTVILISYGRNPYLTSNCEEANLLCCVI